MNIIVRLLADKLDFENGRPKTSYKHRLLAMIDEFPALGKLDTLVFSGQDFRRKSCDRPSNAQRFLAGRSCG